MTQPSLTDFLLQRLSEDEAAARAAIDPDRPGTHWRWVVPDDGSDPDAPRWLRTTEVFPTTSGVGPLPAFPLGFEFKAEPSRGMDHIARHDPARVLADVEAKRKIVERCAYATQDSFAGDYDLAPRCDLAWDILCDLASVFADHPDYRAEWRP